MNLMVRIPDNIFNAVNVILYINNIYMSRDMTDLSHFYQIVVRMLTRQKLVKFDSTEEKFRQIIKQVFACVYKCACARLCVCVKDNVKFPDVLQ